MKAPSPTQKLEDDGRLPEEVLEALEPGTSMGGARPKVTIEADQKIWLAKLPEKGDQHNMQRIEFATLELARFTGLRVCRSRLERLGSKEALLLERFDRQRVEQSPQDGPQEAPQKGSQKGGYLRHGLVFGLTVLDPEDGHVGRERWISLKA